MVNQLYALVFGIFITMGAGGYFYYKDSQATIASLKKQQAQFELKISEQDQTIVELRSALTNQADDLNALQASISDYEAEMDRYLSIFKRHNLTRLAAAKPDWVSNIINDGTKDVFDSIEDASRSVDSLDDGLQLAPAGSSNSNENN